MNKASIEVLLMTFKKQILGQARLILEKHNKYEGLKGYCDTIVTNALKAVWENLSDLQVEDEVDFLEIIKTTESDIYIQTTMANIKAEKPALKAMDSHKLAQTDVLKILTIFINTGQIDQEKLSQFVLAI